MHNWIVKFKHQSNRVKALDFHNSRPWILIAYHNGYLEIWDFKLNTLIQKYKQHQGPVRAAHFHPNQPIFLSGGDDAAINVYNYKKQLLSFSLKGHVDYVRTAFFHPNLPWILSASDDQTLRLWNYQSRICLAIIPGHSHYVMCGQFHQQKNLIVSCSLDCTVRLWDYSNLKKKCTSNKDDADISVQVELVKIMEGHQRGINWCCFHPFQNLIATGADDKKVVIFEQIKIWKYTTSVAWQSTTISGHTNNVVSVCFHDSGQLMTCSQDKTLKIWDIKYDKQIYTRKLEKSRYWIIAKHPKKANLIAGGNDGGFEIYQLHSSLVQSIKTQNAIIYNKQQKLYLLQLKSKIKKQQLYQHKFKLKTDYYQQFGLNPYNNKLCYEKIFQQQISKDLKVSLFKLKIYNACLQHPKYTQSVYNLKSACFINQHIFLGLGQDEYFHLIDIQNKQQNVFKIDHIQFTGVFAAFINSFFGLSTQNKLYLISIQQKCQLVYDLKDNKTIQSITNSYSNLHFALNLGKKIIILNHKFIKTCQLQSQFPIIKVLWHQQKQFCIFNTSFHLKYLIANGCSGIIKCINQQQQIVSIQKNEILIFNISEEFVHKLNLQKDSQQLNLKYSLYVKNWNQTKQAIHKLNPNFYSMKSFLAQQNYGEISQYLIKKQDLRQKLEMAFYSSDLQSAFEICQSLKDKDCWSRLITQSSKLGIHPYMQKGYQKLLQYDKLSFLYACIGNRQKLQKMLVISKNKQLVMNRFSNAIFLDDFTQRAKILLQTGHTTLAYCVAKNYGLNQVAQRIGKQLDQIQEVQGQRLQIPKIINCEFDAWPQNEIQSEVQSVIELLKKQEVKDQ